MSEIRVYWVPIIADPAYPTLAELHAGVDITSYVDPASIMLGRRMRIRRMHVAYGRRLRCRRGRR